MLSWRWSPSVLLLLLSRGFLLAALPATSLTPLVPPPAVAAVSAISIPSVQAGLATALILFTLIILTIFLIVSFLVACFGTWYPKHSSVVAVIFFSFILAESIAVLAAAFSPRSTTLINAAMLTVALCLSLGLSGLFLAYPRQILPATMACLVASTITALTQSILALLTLSNKVSLRVLQTLPLPLLLVTTICIFLVTRIRPKTAMILATALFPMASISSITALFLTTPAVNEWVTLTIPQEWILFVTNILFAIIICSTGVWFQRKTGPSAEQWYRLIVGKKESRVSSYPWMGPQSINTSSLPSGTTASSNGSAHPSPAPMLYSKTPTWTFPSVDRRRDSNISNPIPDPPRRMSLAAQRDFMQRVDLDHPIAPRDRSKTLHPDMNRQREGFDIAVGVP